MYKMMFFIANKFEKTAFRLKKYFNKKIYDSFLKKYDLCDGVMKNKTDIRFNPYEGTQLTLIDSLIDSKVISESESILDIGCGAGIFLIYLASKGFKNLYGIEMDTELYDICQKNISSFFQKTDNIKVSINVYNSNAIAQSVDDSISCFYLFNTFYDKQTYLEWLSKLEESLFRNKRKVKIILLYPTVASMGAMRACQWLQEKQRVICPMVNCKRCVNFLIYESEDVI